MCLERINMEPLVKKDILSILDIAVEIIKQKDMAALDELSNHTVHDASIFQDKNAIQIAVVIYALSKTIRRCETEPRLWKELRKKVVKELEKSKEFLKQDNEEEYAKLIKHVLEQIGKLDSKLKLYIDDVLDKARIVKGAKLYEHGLSISVAAQLLGVSEWELLSYVGKTQIIDQYNEEVIPAKDRLLYAKAIFNIRK